eukprot:gene323-346_t
MILSIGYLSFHSAFQFIGRPRHIFQFASQLLKKTPSSSSSSSSTSVRHPPVGLLSHRFYATSSSSSSSSSSYGQSSRRKGKDQFTDNNNHKKKKERMKGEREIEEVKGEIEEDSQEIDGKSYPNLGLVLERLGDRLVVKHLQSDDLVMGSNESGSDERKNDETIAKEGVFQCVQRSHLSSVTIVPGDRVRFAVSNTNINTTTTSSSGAGGEVRQGIVNELLPRTNLLERPAASTGDLRKKTTFKAICSNIDQLIIVLAAQPYVPLHTADRYLVTAEAAAIPHTILLVNKIDLPESEAFLKTVKDYFRGLNVTLLTASSTVSSERGLDELKEVLKGKTSIFVGQSGVGKSSLINRLIPSIAAKVGPLSKDSQYGSHTTSNTRLYELEGVDGGHLLDSPGVREMAVWHYSPEQIEAGYAEIAHYAKECKFRDCLHVGQSEQVCGVQRALQRGDIHPLRYRSYYDLIRSS